MKLKAFLITFLRLHFGEIKKLGGTGFKYEQKWKEILSFLAELGFSRARS